MFQTLSCWLSSYFHHLCFAPKLSSDQVLKLRSFASMKEQMISCLSGVVTAPGTENRPNADASLLLPWCLDGESRDQPVVVAWLQLFKMLSTLTLTLTLLDIDTDTDMNSTGVWLLLLYEKAAPALDRLLLSPNQCRLWKCQRRSLAVDPLVSIRASFYGVSFINLLLLTFFGASLMMTLDQWRLPPTNDKDW